MFRKTLKLKSSVKQNKNALDKHIANIQFQLDSSQNESHVSSKLQLCNSNV